MTRAYIYLGFTPHVHDANVCGLRLQRNSGLGVRIKEENKLWCKEKSIHLFLPLLSSVPPTGLSSCAELLLQQLGFEVGGNFLVNAVLLRKYHFTEFKSSYESAGAILWKCALPAEEFSQHRDQALQLEESSTSRIGYWTFLLLESWSSKYGDFSWAKSSDLPWRWPPGQMKLRKEEALKPQLQRSEKRCFTLLYSPFCELPLSAWLWWGTFN